MNLYQIEQDLLELYAQVEENGGEITSEIEEKLNITQENFTNKLENYTRFVKVLEGDIALMDSEIERINKLKQTRQNLINRLELSMLNALKLFGNKDPKKDIWRFDLVTFKLSTRQSQSVEILDETVIDSKYKTVKTTESISKTLIKEAIADGQAVNGAIIKINHSLTIK